MSCIKISYFSVFATVWLVEAAASTFCTSLDLTQKKIEEIIIQPCRENSFKLIAYLFEKTPSL